MKQLRNALGATALILTSSLAAQPAKTAPPQKPAAAPAVHAATPAAATVDLNTATVKELEALPEIGAAKAKQIVAGRPWANKAQLVAKGVLTQAQYDKVKDHLVAKQH